MPNIDGTDYDELYVKLEMRNEFKPVHMNINKLIEGSTMPINGAEFELYKTDGNGLEIGTPVAKGISGANEADEEKGMLTFYSVDENGEYLLVDGEKVIHPIGEPDSFIYTDSEENANYAEYKIVENKQVKQTGNISLIQQTKRDDYGWYSLLTIRLITGRSELEN